MTTYYVSPTGNDTNNGLTLTTAWRTIGRANTVMVGGDTTYVQAGTYNESITFSRSGTSGNPISFIGQGTVIMDGTNSRTNGFTASGRAYINITNFTIRNYTQYGIYVTNSNNIICDGHDIYNINGAVRFENNASYSTISNSKCHDSSWNTIMVYGDPDYISNPSHHITILNNEIYNSGHSCIDIHTTASYIDIIGNIVHKDTGAGNGGIFVHNGYVAGRFHRNIRVLNNTVYNNYWSIVFENCIDSIMQGNVCYSNSRGIDSDSGNNVQIRNNIVHSCGTEGVSTFDILGTTSQNIVIESNTINSINGSGIVIQGNHPFIIKNNIITGCSTGINAGSSSVTSYNDVWSNNTNYSGGVTAGTGSISVNPQYYNTSIRDFHLMSQYGRYNPATQSWVQDTVHSPCIDAGDPASDDLSEPTSTAPARIDMGAYGNTPEASYNGTPSGCPAVVCNLMISN